MLLQQIRTEGIFAALNDCNLRNVGRYHHTLMIDLDEYIIPRQVDNYQQLINKIGPNKSAYIFKVRKFAIAKNSSLIIKNILKIKYIY